MKTPAFSSSTLMPRWRREMCIFSPITVANFLSQMRHTMRSSGMARLRGSRFSGGSTPSCRFFKWFLYPNRFCEEDKTCINQ